MPADDRRHLGIALLALHEFVRRTGGGHYPRRNVSTFNDLAYDCGCGRTHRFAVQTTQVLLELADDRLVLQCPDTAAMTCVEVTRP
jgi:hypothetical protein